MTEVPISEDNLRYVKAFKLVIDNLMDDKEHDLAECLSVIIPLGIEKMLRDLIPPAYTENEEELLQETITTMFRENPEFVANFVAEMLKSGEKIREEHIKREKEKMKSYI